MTRILFAFFSRLQISQRWLWLILIVYAITGVAYAVVAPPLEVSDEPRHYAMVEWLAQGRALPIQRIGQGDADAPYGQEGSQPPLYYALMALVAQPFDRGDYAQVWRFNPHTQSMGRADATTNRTQLLHTPDQVFPWRGTVLAVMVMRLLGVLMGGVTVACAFGLAKGMTTDDGRPTTEDDSSSVVRRPSSLIPFLAAALTAFNPMFLHIMASVNNDTLATMLSALALVLGMRMIRHGVTPRQGLLLGVVLGGAALTKASGLALVGVVPFFVVLAQWAKARQHAGSLPALRASLPAVCSMLGPALAIAGWWYVRNAVLYGDPTGTAMMAQIVGPRVPPLSSVFELVAEWRSFFTAYWGMFGALNIPMSDWVYPALEVLWLLAGLGLVWAGVDWVVALGQRPPNTRGLLIVLQSPRVLIGLMALGAIAVAFLALLRWSSITLASQGRLLFPVIAAISTFTAIGLVQLISGIAQLLSASKLRLAPAVMSVSVIVALVALAVATPFTTIAPAYARPNLFANESQLPNHIVRTELSFAGQIRWLGYVAEPARVHPGDILNVTLYWQALQPISKDYSLGLRLFGRASANSSANSATNNAALSAAISDTEVLVLDTYPGGGMWQTTLWQPGQIVADHYRLRIPSNPTVTQMLPTALKLDVGFYELNGFQFITDTRDAQGQPSGRQRYTIASLGAAQPQSVNGGAVPYLEQAKLLDVTATQENGPEGRRIRFATRWQATSNMSQDYTMFVQLWPKDATAGAPPLSQADGPTEQLPARWWQAGDVIEDVRYLNVPADAPPGPVIIKFGLYKPIEPYERMPAFDANHAPLPDRALQVELDLN